MFDWIKWGLPIIVGIFGFFIGRYWKILDSSRDKDKDTLARLDKYLPFETVNYIREHDFASLFSMEFYYVLKGFSVESSNPDFIFLNKDLEKNRKKLLKLTQEFTQIITFRGFQAENIVLGYNEFPYFNEFANQDEWQELIDKGHGLADDIFKTYSYIKQTARRIL